MSATYLTSIAGRNAACSGFVQGIDNGSIHVAGSIILYPGTKRSTPDVAAVVSPLATLNFNLPSFIPPISGSASVNNSPALMGTVTSSGIVTWFSIQDRNGNTMSDGSVGTSGADIIMDEINLQAGGTITLTSLLITYPM